MCIRDREYRTQRGIGFKDEQMALLIQRVTGSMYEDSLMPNVAGVGYSYSAYKWDDSIDASDGMLRLVMGDVYKRQHSACFNRSFTPYQCDQLCLTGNSFRKNRIACPDAVRSVCIASPYSQMCIRDSRSTATA